MNASVLLNDNAPVHNKAAIMTLCDRFKVTSIFLEPYSDDYSPIELVFHSAKDDCHMRRRDTKSKVYVTER